jgi:signal transduction histidine kinase
MKTSKVALKLAIGIAVLIILIESILLFISIEKKRSDLTRLQGIEAKAYGINKIITHEYIKYELDKYTKNISYLTVIISLLVILGTFYIYYHLVGKYLTKITNHNRQNNPRSRNVLLKEIPNDEIGELILSRENMLATLENKINENKILTRMLAHDISNTLSVAIGNTDSLLKYGESRDPEYRLQKLQKIAKACFAQKDLIDRVRKMEAASSNKQGLLLKNENLVEIIKNSLFIFDEKLKSKNLSLIFQSNIPHETIIKTDNVLFINNVTNNLISNAIKFSNENERIEISLDKNSKGNLLISIKDFGIGIPKNYIDIIFNPNIKTSREGTKGESGTGFGLPLAYSTVKLLGGNIIVKSKAIDDFPEEHWTIFTIELNPIDSINIATTI